MDGRRKLQLRHTLGPRGEPNAHNLEKEVLHFLHGREKQTIRTITQVLECSRDRIYVTLKKLARRNQVIESREKNRLHFTVAKNTTAH